MTGGFKVTVRGEFGTSGATMADIKEFVQQSEAHGISPGYTPYVTFEETGRVAPDGETYLAKIVSIEVTGSVEELR